MAEGRKEGGGGGAVSFPVLPHGRGRWFGRFARLFRSCFFFFFNKLDDFLLHRYLFCLLDMGWVRVGREGGGRPVCFGSAMDSSSVDYDLVACVSSLMNIHPRFFFRRVPCCQCTTSVVCSVGRRGEGEAAGEQVLRKRVRGGEGMSRTHTSCEDPCATRPDLI